MYLKQIRFSEIKNSLPCSTDYLLALYEAQRKRVNPNNNELTVLNYFSGAGIIEMLYGINGTRHFFVSDNYEDLTGQALAQLIDQDSRQLSSQEIDYLSYKLSSGYAVSPDIYGKPNLLSALKAETTFLGIEPSTLHIDQEMDAPILSFKWENPLKATVREYSITFIYTENILNEETYHPLLKNILSGSKGLIDIYYQKAPMQAPKHYRDPHCYLERVYDILGTDGFFITDDVACLPSGFTDYSQDFPFPMKMHSLPNTDDYLSKVFYQQDEDNSFIPDQLQEIRFKSAYFRYGLDLRIRQKYLHIQN